MRIRINEMIEDNDFYYKLDLVGKKVYDYKFNYVIERLDVLSDEIIEEENNNKYAHIMLYMNGDTVNDFIKFKGYSKILSERIIGCFTSVDTMSFENRIYQLRDETLN